MPIRILAIGDIVGRRSVRYLGEQLRRLRDRLGADFTVVNGENAADIHGIAVQDAEAILEAGADLITLGNHAFGQRDIGHFLDDRPDRIIRPANFRARQADAVHQSVRDGSHGRAGQPLHGRGAHPCGGKGQV